MACDDGMERKEVEVGGHGGGRGSWGSARQP